MELQVKPRATGINKKDLTEQLAKVANIPKVRAAEYINILTNIISNALQEGKKVTISDFGTLLSLAFSQSPQFSLVCHTEQRFTSTWRAAELL